MELLLLSSCRPSVPRNWAFLPMAKFIAFAYAGCDPEEMGIGPIHAIPKVLKMAGLSLEESM